MKNKGWLLGAGGVGSPSRRGRPICSRSICVCISTTDMLASLAMMLVDVAWSQLSAREKNNKYGPVRFRYRT